VTISALTKQETFYWDTTPEELRTIADKLEQRAQQLKVGDSCTTHIVDPVGFCRLAIRVDQAYVHAVQRG
jgi:hypothetical protein